MNPFAVEVLSDLSNEPVKASVLRILIVEDEVITAVGLIDVVSALDASSVIALRADAALALIASEAFDAAIIDMNLAEEAADAVLDALFARGTPFIITTGYGVQAIPAKYRSVPFLDKPYKPEQVEIALLRLLTPTSR